MPIYTNNKIEKLVNYCRIIKSINLHRTQLNMTLDDACKACGIKERQYYTFQKYFNENKRILEDALDVNTVFLNGGKSFANSGKRQLNSSNINVVLSTNRENSKFENNNAEHNHEKRTKLKTKQEQKKKFDEMLKLAESKLTQ